MEEGWGQAGVRDSGTSTNSGLESDYDEDDLEFDLSSDEIESIEDPPNLFDRGVSIELLLDLAADHDLENKTTRQVIEEFVVPQTSDYECSLAGLMKRSFPETVGRATHYIIHPWDASFGRLVRMLVAVDAAYREEFSAGTKERGKGPYGAMFWIDVFAIDQPQHFQAYNESEELWLYRDQLLQDVRTCIEMIPYVCLFMDPSPAPTLLRRAWCLYECMQALDYDKHILFCPFPDPPGVRSMRDALSDFQQAVKSFTPDFARSETFLEQDKQWLYTAVSAAHPSGAARLNEQVGNVALHWLCDQVLKELSFLETTPPIESVHQLGSLLESLGKYEDAHVQYLLALELAEDQLGLEHWRRLAILHDLACLEAKHFHWFQRAEGYLREALDGREQIFGIYHDSPSETVSALARLLQAQGRSEEAESLYRRALDHYLVEHGISHRETLVAANSLALLLQDKATFLEAFSLLSRVTVAGANLLGAKHLDVLVWRNNLAVLLQDMKQLKRAEAVFRKALTDCEQAFGTSHAQTLNIVYNLGQCLWQQGKLRAAETLFRRELKGCKELLGLEHGDTRRSIKNMVEFLNSQGREEEVAEFESLFYDTEEEAEEQEEEQVGESDVESHTPLSKEQE